VKDPSFSMLDNFEVSWQICCGIYFDLGKMAATYIFAFCVILKLLV